MNYEPGRVRILVNDRGAAYPITIDPLIYLEQKAIASDGAAGDYFGYSVALSGDTALVGAYVMMWARTMIKAQPMSLCAAGRPGHSRHN